MTILYKTHITKTLIILTVLCLHYASAYFEASIWRNATQYTINTNEVIADLVQASEKCQKNLTNFAHNKMVTTQLCFEKDLFFNLQVMLGDFDPNNKVAQILNLTLDINIPWTWIKTKSCKQCNRNQVQISPDNYMQNMSYKQYVQQLDNQCTSSCRLQSPSTSFSYDLPKNKSRLTQRPGTILHEDQILYGKYFYDQIQMLTYDVDKKLSFWELIQTELTRDQFQALDEIQKIKRFKILGVNRIMGYEDFLADGALGLGYLDEDSDDSEIEADTNFLQMMMVQREEYRINHVMFGIYINELNERTPDFALTFGGYDQSRYAQNDTQSLFYVDLNQQRGPYWSIPLQSLSIIIDGFETDKNTVTFGKNSQAILTLSATYIAFPLKELQIFMSILNQIDGAVCQVVDKQYFVVFCKNLRKNHVENFDFEVKFRGKDRSLKLDGFALFRDCFNLPENLSENDRFDCTLNVRLSRDSRIILGEPFIKQHYTVFDQEGKRVGFLPAATSSLWHDQYERGYFDWLIHAVTVIFIIGLFFIFCFKTIRRTYKCIKNWITRRGFKFDPNEKLKFSSAAQEDDMWQEVGEQQNKIKIHSDGKDAQGLSTEESNNFDNKLGAI